MTIVIHNKPGTSFQAARLAANTTITITVISKKRVYTTITGIAGQIFIKE